MALMGDTSELDTLLYGGKYMLPEAASYTMTTPWGVVSSDVSGGFVRQQLKFFNSPAQVQVVYRCVSKVRVDFLKAFIRLHEGLPFIAALAVDTDDVEPYVVDVVGAPTWQENGFSGTCTLTYQVQPTPNADYDEFLQWSGATLGDYQLEFANWIAKTANIDLPIYTTGTTAAFVSGIYYDNTTPVGFSDLVTFSRLSGATYIKDGVLKTAADNEPRFESGGLLIEGQSTNLLKNSNPVAGANSTDYRRGSTVLNPVVGINSYSFATVNGSASGWCEVLTAIGIYPAGTYTARAKIQVPNSSFYANLRGLVGGVDTTLASVASVSSGYINVTSTTSQEVTRLALRIGFIAGVPDDSSIVIESPQIEAGLAASSYIPTTGTAATRAADSASVDMQPHTAGTIFAEFLSDAVTIERVVYTAGSVTLKRLASGAISVTNGAVTVTSAVVPTGSVKAAISYDGATLKLAVNGVVYSAASVLPSAGVSIALGNTTFANVWQRSEAYDNARLVEVTQ